MADHSHPPRGWRRLEFRVAAVALVVLAGVAGASFAVDASSDGEPDIVVRAPLETDVRDEAPEGAIAAMVAPAPTAEPHLREEIESANLDAERAPIEVELTPSEVGNGETLLVRAEAPGVARGTVEVLGQTYPLMREGDVLWALVGIPLLARLGPERLQVHLYDARGERIETADAEFRVRLIERPVDHVYLTPEQAAVSTPETQRIEREIRVEQFVVFDRPKRWEGAWLVPTEGWTTTPFGEGRSYNDGPVGSYHLGHDIANAEGTPVIAPAHGRVAWVGPMPLRGNSVLIDHGAGVVSGYHHLYEWSVEVGDDLEPGDLVGLMGTTGLSSGPHLHWELLIYGVNVDPMTWTEMEFEP
jgi:murein DD-endopeptidase MepM/ murein hydrolase activator NlpD